MQISRKRLFALTCSIDLGALPSSVSAMAPPTASSEAEDKAAREAFVAALPLDDAIMANWDRLAWPLADKLMQDPSWAPPEGLRKEMLASGFLRVFFQDMQRLMPSILPEVRAELVHGWRDLQTADDWRRETTFAQTPSGRKMFVMMLSESPSVIAAARHALYPRVTADRADLYGRAVEAGVKWQNSRLPPLTRPSEAGQPQATGAH